MDSSFNVSEDSVYCNISAPDKIDPKAKHSGVVKMKLDGTERQDITKERIYRFTLSNDWLYYIPSGLTDVYKCKTDGSEVNLAPFMK